MDCNNKKPGDIFETEHGIALATKIDEDYPNLIHIIIGRRKGYVFDMDKGIVKDFFSAILDITFSNIKVEDVNNVRKQVRSDMMKRSNVLVSSESKFD